MKKKSKKLCNSNAEYMVKKWLICHNVLEHEFRIVREFKHEWDKDAQDIWNDKWAKKDHQVFFIIEDAYVRVKWIINKLNKKGE